MAPTLEAQNLNPWTTREVLYFIKTLKIESNKYLLRILLQASSVLDPKDII